MSCLARIASFSLLGLLLLAGCSQSGSLDAKTLAEYRAQLTLAEEPDAVQTVVDVRVTLLGETEPDDDQADQEHGHEDHEHDHAPVGPIEASVVGHIGGLANPWETQRDFPFNKTKAVFFLADPQAVVENEASGHSHAPGEEECVFCAAHAADNSERLAMVQLVDPTGKVFPVDVRQLFDLNEKDMVVVHGSARITEGGMMVINATGIYVRK